jgi:hypothetical protein
LLSAPEGVRAELAEKEPLTRQRFPFPWVPKETNKKGTLSIVHKNKNVVYLVGLLPHLFTPSSQFRVLECNKYVLVFSKCSWCLQICTEGNVHRYHVVSWWPVTKTSNLVGHFTAPLAHITGMEMKILKPGLYRPAAANHNPLPSHTCLYLYLVVAPCLGLTSSHRKMNGADVQQKLVK